MWNRNVVTATLGKQNLPPESPWASLFLQPTPVSTSSICTIYITIIFYFLSGSLKAQSVFIFVFGTQLVLIKFFQSND